MQACSSIEEVFQRVQDGEVEFGVVPVENSTEGAVNNTQDCLLSTPLHIVGETVLPIQHNLLCAPNAGPDQLHTVASHKQSLAQCRDWLEAHFPQLTRRECASNAQAAEAARDEQGVAAIAGEFAAGIYGLQILAASIQDHSHNSTRFLILHRQPDAQERRDASVPSDLPSKTSLLVATQNKPGALYALLGPFDYLQLDLAKIEARPSKKRAWEYVFFIDFLSLDSEQSKVDELLRALRPLTTSLRILGSYSAAQNVSAND
jgi:chorismate mutase/prephenate dehydratase